MITEVTSAGPSRRARSVGFIGVASTRTTISSSRGSSIETSSIDSVRRPSPLMVDRISFPVIINSSSSHEHQGRSEEHTSELQSLMRISYAVFCLKKKKRYQKTSTVKTRYHK